MRTDAVAWLFCPANRPDRYAKAAERADVVILDLEDGVGAAQRPQARNALIEHPLDPARTVIRINPFGTVDHSLDLDAVRSTGYTTVMLAKAESAAQVDNLAPLRVVALCETPLGVINSLSIAAHTQVDALMWGAQDLLASLGGTTSRRADGSYREIVRHARSTVLLAACAADKLSIDAVYLDISDLAGLADETEDAAACGFAAKACIHPVQVEPVRRGFTPRTEEVAWARRVLHAVPPDGDAFALDGQMIDEPLLRQARRILSRSR